MSNLNKNDQKKNLTAAQRLDALEQGLAMVDSTIGELFNTLDRTTRAITLLSKKLEAIKRAADITDDQIAKILQDIDIDDLKSRVDDLINKNMLKPSELIDIEKTLVVARELNRNTNEISNLRTQFLTFNLPENIKILFSGKKVGDIVDLGENRNLIEILEIYEVLLPEPPKNDIEQESVGQEASEQTSKEIQPAATSA